MSLDRFFENIRLLSHSKGPSDGIKVDGFPSARHNTAAVAMQLYCDPRESVTMMTLIASRKFYALSGLDIFSDILTFHLEVSSAENMRSASFRNAAQKCATRRSKDDDDLFSENAEIAGND